MNESLIDIIRKYFESQPVVRAWVFGSVARGEQTPESDIDIMVAFDHDAHVGLMKYAKMYTELKDLLGIEVDLVQEGALKTYAAESAERDRILIYERA